MIRKSRMFLATPGPLLTPPPSHRRLVCVDVGCWARGTGWTVQLGVTTAVYAFAPVKRRTRVAAAGVPQETCVEVRNAF
jgi:hypothetical protein